MSDKPLSTQTTDFGSLVHDLNAGVFLQKLDRAMSDVALGVVSNGKKGKVKVEFTFKQIGDSNQVAMTHTVSWDAPTKRGKFSETDSTDTPLHVGPRGRLTIYPEEQTELFARERDRERS